jgi:hypothetical protein
MIAFVVVMLRPVLILIVTITTLGSGTILVLTWLLIFQICQDVIDRCARIRTHPRPISWPAGSW